MIYVQRWFFPRCRRRANRQPNLPSQEQPPAGPCPPHIFCSCVALFSPRAVHVQSAFSARSVRVQTAFNTKKQIPNMQTYAGNVSTNAVLQHSSHQTALLNLSNSKPHHHHLCRNIAAHRHRKCWNVTHRSNKVELTASTPTFPNHSCSMMLHVNIPHQHCVATEMAQQIWIRLF